MENLIGAFHIDYKILIAQLINFTIVLFVLYKFAYNPILKIINARTEKIEKGLKDAEEARKKLEETEIKEKEILNRARKEAQIILESAEKMAVKNKEEVMENAKKKSEEIMTVAKKQLEEERKKMIGEVKAEIADLVVAATEKIISEKLDAHKDKELIEKIIK